MVNLKALELAKKIQWEFYTSSSLVYDGVNFDKMKVRFLTGQINCAFCYAVLIFSVSLSYGHKCVPPSPAFVHDCSYS
jgi:hypothetical protein